MKGGSSNLEYAIRNILTSSIPVTPPTYEWNIPADIETNPSCKLKRLSILLIYLYIVLFLFRCSRFDW